MVSLKLTSIALVALRALSAVAQVPEGVEVRYYPPKSFRTLTDHSIQIEDIQEVQDEVDDPTKQQSPVLKVDISTSFPDSEVFGVKVVNGHPTRAVLDVHNQEPEAVNFLIVGGSLSTPVDVPGAPDPPVILRNLTTQRYQLAIPAGSKETITYTFTNEMHPQDLRLNLAAVLQNQAGNVFTKQVYNETVSIVEAPMSFFDPQV